MGLTIPVQGDSPSHHTPRHNIIAQLPFSNNIAQLPGLGLDIFPGYELLRKLTFPLQF